MRRQPGIMQKEDNMNFDQLTDLILRLLDAAWGKDWGRFMKAFPNGTNPDNTETPIITYRLKEMTPGIIGKDGTREIKPRERGTYQSKDEAGNPMFVTMKGQVLDCTVEFDVLDDTSAGATALAMKFMDFLSVYTGYIQGQGARNIIFEKYEDTTEVVAKDGIASIRLTYYVGLERLYEENSGVIEKVTGIVSPKGDLSDDSINEGIPFNVGE